ncbi:hypothetical protein HBI70_240610 [Parastagonospora nodorum]|nr:hypothetical protein HBI70_240610 [Parastagonospora nodorum]
MCAKDDLVRRKGPLSTSTQTSNHVDTFSLDFAFSFANILSLIAFIISYRLFADELRSIPSTLLARFIPITKIRDPLLKKNAAKSGILLACADGRTRQCYLTICAILKHYNFNIYVSLATDILHLLLKGLVMKMLDFMQDMLDDIYPSKQKAIIQQLIAVVSLLFILKAPFALHFIRAVCDLVTLAQYKNIRMYGALDSIYTRANSEAHYITILILGIQPHLTKLPLSEVAANIAISDFTHAVAVSCISIQIYPSIKCWRSSSKRYNDPKHCNEELYLILIIIDYTCYDKDRKHMAYIRVFSEVLLFNNNRQIDNTTRMLSMPFKFYDLSMIIRLVHLVPRDLPNLTTRTTMSYYVNNYIN